MSSSETIESDSDTTVSRRSVQKTTSRKRRYTSGTSSRPVLPETGPVWWVRIAKRRRNEYYTVYSTPKRSPTWRILNPNYKEGGETPRYAAIRLSKVISEEDQARLSKLIYKDVVSTDVYVAFSDNCRLAQSSTHPRPTA
jgi:hypothetical protein